MLYANLFSRTNKQLEEIVSLSFEDFNPFWTWFHMLENVDLNLNRLNVSTISFTILHLDSSSSFVFYMLFPLCTYKWERAKLLDSQILLQITLQHVSHTNRTWRRRRRALSIRLPSLQRSNREGLRQVAPPTVYVCECCWCIAPVACVMQSEYVWQVRVVPRRLHFLLWVWSYIWSLLISWRFP